MSLKTTDLISADYLVTQKVLHATPRGYGAGGHVWAPTVLELVTRYQASAVLDYGAGRGTLGAALRLAGVECREYDPAIAGLDTRPSFADLVTCTDCLEHIEPDRLDRVLAHLRQLARRAVFLVIATRPSNKTLLDGRNAHLIVKDAAWWQARVVAAGFTLEAPPGVPPAKPQPPCWVAVVRP